MRARPKRYVELAAVNKHHVPGTAYHWKHDYIPLDRATALANRKGALAKKLFGAGAPHWKLEPGQHDLGLHPAKAKPKEIVPPKAPEPLGNYTINGKSVSKDVYLKSLQKSVKEQGGYHKISDGKLDHLARLGDERAKLHQTVRQQINERDQAIRDNIERGYQRHKSGEQRFIPFGEHNTPEKYRDHRIEQHENLYTTANKRDLEKRQVASEVRNQGKINKMVADRQAREDAKRAAENNPADLEAWQEKVRTPNLNHPNGGTIDYYGLPSSVLEEGAAKGDQRAASALSYVKKREAKRAKAAAEGARQADAYAHVSKPGDPVSQSVNVPKASNTINDGARRALAAIDRVHHDGELVPIKLKTSNARGFYGKYTWHTGNPAADNISLSTEGDHQATTMAHEVGHWLDHIPLHSDAGTERPVNRRIQYMSTRAAAAGGKTMLGVAPSDAGDVSPAWQAWWKAIGDSAEIKELADRERNHKGGYRMGGRVQGGNLTYAGYMLQPHEQWARAYAQYIATKSGDAKMQSEIKDLVSLRGKGENDLQGFSQWTPEEFAPIAKAIDAIIAEKGWSK